MEKSEEDSAFLSPKKSVRRSRGSPHALDPDAPLSVACGLLAARLSKHLPGRICTFLGFDFDRGGVHLISLIDADGDFITEVDHILAEPAAGVSLDARLEIAVGMLLDEHLPQWNGNPGAEGFVSATLQSCPGDKPKVRFRGLAVFRSNVELPIRFPI